MMNGRSKLRTSLLAVVILSATLRWFQVVQMARELVAYEMEIWNHPVISGGISNDTFSACLLTNDDNHFLTEWLAYHYTALPLRRLIIAVDPRSRTSPEQILNRWIPYLNITIWRDDDFFPKAYRQSILRSTKHTTASAKLVFLHRSRQRFLYDECIHKLKNEKSNWTRNWVSFIDSDEFLFPNRNWKYQFLLPHRDEIERTSVAQLLHRLTVYETFRTSCIGLPRLSFGIKAFNESHVKAIVENDNLDFDTLEATRRDVLSSQSNLSSLLTWEWLWHENFGDNLKNKAGKAILDLSRIPRQDFRFHQVDVHRPNRAHCSSDHVWIANSDSPLVLHHYVGSLEQFTFRNDPREGKRTPDIYQEYESANYSSVHPWDSRSWLLDFVLEVGLAEAQRLLRGTGEVEKNPGPMLPEDVFLQRLNESILADKKNTLAS